MATRQITIDDGSKKRKQVELNLNPVALNPTVRAGGNYRVAVQQTPLTNSAKQLSKALKEGVNAYGQAVDVAQKKAAEDVANMSDADYDKFVQQGLDPEARSLFGYTKTYNRQLAQKYYATEIPTKLQELSNDMFKNYYDYKDAASFEAALEERVGSVYEEADQLLGGNVFGEQANNALKSATRADFLSKEVAKFSRELPARNKQMAMESMARQFDGITSANVDQIATIGGDLINSHKGTLGGRAAAEAVFGTLQTKMNTLLASDSSVDHQLLEDMIEEIGDGKGEDNMVAGQELFATPTRQLYLTQMEKELEKRKDDSYNDAVRDSKVHLASIQAAVIRIPSEGTGKNYLDSAIKAMSIHGGVFNDVTYENDILRDIMTVELNKMKANPLLFEREAAANFIARENSSQRSVDEYVFINLPASFLDRSDVDGKVQGFTAAGQEFQEQYALKRDTMYDALYRAVIDIEDEGAQRLAFKEGEVELVKDLKEWVKETTNSSTAVAADAKATRVQENEKIVGPEEVARILAEHGPDIGPRVIEHLAEQQRQELVDKNLTKDVGGKAVLGGTFNSTKLDNFEDVLKLDILNPEQTISVFNDAHKAAWGNNTLQLGFAGKIHNPSEIEKLLFKMMTKKLPRIDHYGVAAAQRTRKPKFEDKLIAGRKIGELMRRIGIPSDVLVKGKIPITNNKLVEGNFSLDYLIENNFLTTTTVPILIDNNIQNTLTAVEAWKDNGGAVSDKIDANHLKTFNQIAENFDLSVQELFSHQYLYLQDNGYLK